MAKNRPKVFGHRGLDSLDELSNHNVMPTNLTWKLVDETGASLGAEREARLKWRQRGVPAAWRIKIAGAMMAQSMPVSLSDFDTLELNPGRIDTPKSTPRSEAAAA